MSKEKFKASFFTLGCRLNQAETALISDRFREKEFEIVEFGAPTDVCVINTCTVTEQADAKCRQVVRQALRRSPDAFVAVVGCYAQIGAKALQEIDGIDLILGTEEKMRVAEFIDVPQKLPKPIVHTPRISRAPFTIASVGNYENSTRANLKIQDGCDFMCSFCIIPFARGRGRSRTFWDIQREAMQLVDRGHKELVLSGVNIGTYSFDGKSLVDVIQMLETINGLERIRISSIEPTTIPEALVDYMAESEKLCNHFHIPIQSGDNAVLRRMRRLYSVFEYVEFFDKVHNRVPDVCLGTDVMVGFPGESETEFSNTRDLLAELPLSYFHVFPYSERKGTASTKLPGALDPATKKSRSQELRDLSRQKNRQFHEKQQGKRLRVLMEERNEFGQFQGVTENYIKVAVETESDYSNQFLDVAVERVSQRNVAIGRIIAKNER